MWKGPRHPERKCPVANLSSWADLPSLIKSEKRNPLRIKDINGYQWISMISRIQSRAVSASIYCSVIALLHICSTDVILWTAGGSENPCLSRGHIELLSHTRPLWRSLECCQQPASQLSPACVTLGKGRKRKRKGKQVKLILSAMVRVPQQTPKQDTHTKKKTVAVLAVQGFNFLQHACTRFHKSMCLQKKAISNWASHGQHLPAEHNAEIPRGPVVQKGSKDTDPPPGWKLDPQSLWGCLGCRWIPSLC